MMFRKRLENFLFYLIVFSLPLNLGKHFVLNLCYVNGRLIDYLIPTLYVQDILVLTLLLIALPRLFKSAHKLLNFRVFAYLILFFVAGFFSVISANSFIPAVYFFFRLFLYASFGVYIFLCRDFYKDFISIAEILGVLLVGLGFLALFQWFNQSSVFDNYLFFGEQPYSFSTPGIIKESLFGFSKIPPYGTFKHPNVFAAFLSFCLLFSLPLFKGRRASPFLYLAWFLGLVALILTFSWFVFLGFFACLLLYLAPKRVLKLAPYSLISLALIFHLFLFFSPLKSFDSNTLAFLPLSFDSLMRRKNLLITGFDLFRQFPLFGVGPNNFTFFVDPLFVLLGSPKFTQPIHNIYLLVFVEFGIFAGTLFLSFLGFLLLKCIQGISRFSETIGTSKILLILLLNFLFLGFFDHFLLTSHQMLLVFWLTIGFSLQYNVVDEV